MLQTLREKITGWVAVVIVGILIVPFAFVGIENYRTRSIADYVAKVGDVEISQAQFSQRLDQQRTQMRNAMGDRFDAALVESPESKRRLLDNLIDAELLRQGATSLGIRILPAQLQEEIAGFEAFQVAGKFDPEQYRLVLAQQGLTPAGFDRLMADDLLVQSLPEAFAKSAIATQADLDGYLKLRDQKRSFRWLKLPVPAVQESVELADAQSYFDAHSADYMTEETVLLDYIELRAADMAVDAVVDEATLRQRYEDASARFVEPEQRLASHILIRLEANADAEAQRMALEQAQQIRTKAMADGADFAEIAKAESQDPGSRAAGGDLGWLTRGLTDPAFEDALFSMAGTGVSEPVKSPEGWHVIQLREVRPEVAKAFEQVKEELKTEALNEERERLFSEQLGLLVDAIYRDPTRLETAASELGLSIQQTEAFTRSGGTGIASNPKVIAAAFSDALLKDGNASDALEIDSGHRVVIKVAQHQPASLQTLEEVRARVDAAVLAERREAAATQQRDSALAALRSAETTMETLAAANNGELMQAEAVGRQGLDTDPRVLADAFKIARSDGKSAFGYAMLGLGEYAVIELQSVTEADVSQVPETERDSLRSQLAQGIGASEVRAYLNALRESTPIVIAEDRIP
jgi:peptidyl-prolyl cis-trans isomerase D